MIQRERHNEKETFVSVTCNYDDTFTCSMQQQQQQRLFGQEKSESGRDVI